MKVFIIGGGGREHALAWKVSLSPMVERIYCAPGNPGIAEIAECVKINDGDVEGYFNFASKHRIDLTIVGPEAPLLSGVVDRFAEGNLPIFGPSKKAAAIEGSKSFAKSLMRKYNIPTADFRIFDDPANAKKYIHSADLPLVIKADGPAMGKGVFICKTVEEADACIVNIMQKRKFGDAGSRIVVEEFLSGEEVSVLAITDGKTIVPLVPVQDHKAVYDGDMGPNTGGMGAYAPVPFVTEDMLYAIEKDIVVPVIHGLNKENRPFVGVIYAGLILTNAGPRVLEFNARFGDPETQVLLMKLKSDLVPLLVSATRGTLDSDNIKVEWHDGAAICVIMASGGYPGGYKRGFSIIGLEKLKGRDNLQVFHAGTSVVDKKIVTNGGRVLGVSAIGKDLLEARKTVYDAIGEISFEGAHYRKDIGSKALQRLQSLRG